MHSMWKVLAGEVLNGKFKYSNLQNSIVSIEFGNSETSSIFQEKSNVYSLTIIKIKDVQKMQLAYASCMENSFFNIHITKR